MGRTLPQVVWPDDPDAARAFGHFSAGASTQLLSYVWQGCDVLQDKRLLPAGGVGTDVDSIERGITQLLVPEIRAAMPLASPFDVEHGIFEFETLIAPKAQPPAYDAAFVLRANRRFIWPIEAKVLETDGTVTRYVNEITDNFLTCRYAPFSAEAAMLGYLLTGTPPKAFRNIENSLSCSLQQNSDFAMRQHRISDHQRTVPKGKNYPVNFRCHHLIFNVGASNGPGRVAP